ncbi:MAG: radical SAM protein [Holophaga sp.]|nr:radical SAM protein [Holophaga sp.]
MSAEVLRQTRSVCPVCLRQVPAERVRIGAEVHLRKVCPDHGAFQAVVWRGLADLEAWLGEAEAGAPLGQSRCPGGCGLCPDHLQGTCCVVLELTRRCDLACRFCFADAGGREPDPGLDQVKAWLAQLAEPGRTLVQLSGGEPTLRPDLPEIIAAARAAGCRHVQLNSNGLRLGEDPGYARALAQAGLSFVFMQFDGTEDAIHERLRGRPLLAAKLRAIDHCAAQNLGVTLVPTVVPGVNDHDIGALLRFAIARAPAVRGVHFQPVSFFGRVPGPPTDAMRFTLDQLLAAIDAQAGGLIRADQLLPSRCDHPLCGFHGDFVVAADGRLVALSRPRTAGTCCGPASPEQNRRFVARRWQRPVPSGAACCGDLGDLGDLDGFLERVRSHGFTVTAMAFQDAGNLDLERLRRCSLHVFDRGRMVPFCAHYLRARR